MIYLPNLNHDEKVMKSCLGNEELPRRNDVIPPSIHDPSSPTSNGSPLRGPTIRSMMRKIQMSIPLNYHQDQSFHTLFT